MIVNSKLRPQGKASVFKVPHHGSKTADQPQVWEEMLDTELIAVLTPFVQGSAPLPTRHDVDRICARTDKSYTTAIFKHKKIKRRGAAEKIIQRTVREIKQVYDSIGQVRLRATPANKALSWEIKLFGDARPLTQLYTGK